MNKSVGSKWSWSGSKKKLSGSVENKRALIEPEHPTLSIRRQCGLLGLNRASYYYQPAQETAENVLLMRLLDEQYMRPPFYGWPRMTAWLRRAGDQVNGKRVRRLMQLMGLQAIYPRPKTSRSGLEQRRYPYLLRDVMIMRPNQVWSADITYVPMPRGFMYLVAVIDRFSRYVLAWKLSNTLDSLFCVEALQEALRSGRPEIFNTDQGAQFTASAWIAILETYGIQISMDGRGRALDNIFVERLWRSVKYEHLYIQEYATVSALEEGLQAYWQFYNHERLHQSLGYHTPAEVHGLGSG
jgi:putative transposase